MRTFTVAILLVPALALAQAPAEPPASDLADDPPAAAAGAQATVSVEAGASAEVTTGATPTGFTVGVAPRLGVTIPTSKLGVFVVGGLEVDFFVAMKRRLVVAIDFTFTRPSYSGSGNDARVGGDYDFTVKEREIKLGLDLVYRFFSPPRRLVPFAGVGGIWHMLRTTQINSLAPGENSEQSNEFGVEILAGVDFALGPGALLGEARLVYSGLDHALTGDVNAGNVTVSLGYRFVF